MQNVLADLHYYLRFQIVYLALHYYTTVGLQMWEHCYNSAFPLLDTSYIDSFLAFNSDSLHWARNLNTHN